MWAIIIPVLCLKREWRYWKPKIPYKCVNIINFQCKTVFLSWFNQWGCSKFVLKVYIRLDLTFNSCIHNIFLTIITRLIPILQQQNWKFLKASLIYFPNLYYIIFRIFKNMQNVLPFQCPFILYFYNDMFLFKHN